MSEFILPALLAIWIAGMLAKRLPGWGQSKPGAPVSYEIRAILYVIALVLVFCLSILVAYAYDQVI